MKVLFDLGHPAHFHVFKNTIASLRSSGHEVEIIARQKDCLGDLLAASSWPHHLIPRKKRTLATLGIETLKAMWLAVSIARKKKIDFMIGTSLVVGPAARLTGATALVFGEDDAAVVPLFAKLAYPMAHYVVTPDFLQFEDSGPKRLTYRGCQALAYLHPARFTPDAKIRDQLGVGAGEKYFLLRLVSLTAHHDIGERGISSAQARQVLQRLLPHGRVFISAEGSVADDLKPHLLPTRPEQIFDVMAFADMMVGDSQTMTTEAALLGTPSLRFNSFVGRLTVRAQMEHRYGLSVGLRPDQFDQVIAQIDSWLNTPDLKDQWRSRRDAMLRECVDLTQWILDLLARLGEKR